MDIYQTLQWMQLQLQQYGQRISALESALQCAEEEIKKLKEKPPIHVGTIQYKFDQLKVETLEGTLNIGLNPQDLQGIEDFAVQGGQQHSPMMPMDMMQRSLGIEEAINTYLDDGLEAFVASAQERLGITGPGSESYLSFIKNDIKKQLPNRIESHLKFAGTAPQNHAADEGIIEAIKKEIENGVLTFLNNLPGNTKGGA